ncbi:hypothetical protein ACET3Z_015123 [Daucus carota]
MLASSLVLLAAMFMSLFFTQHPALAVSYGRMGSSSRSSSRSSSSSSSSRPFRTSSSSFASYRRRRRRNYYQENSITCTNCSCFKEKKSELDSSSSDVNNGTNLLTSNSNRKGHSPCKCTCHSATIPKPVWVIICIVFILFVIKEGKHQNSDCKTEVADIRMGSVLMVQVGILDKKRELQRKLNRIAGTADTYTIKGLNNLKKVVKALLEHHDSCHFAYLFAKYDDMEKYSRPCFRGFLETEVAKFDKEDETFVNVDGVICKKDFGGNVISIDNEYSVVTLLVLADGESWIPSVKWHTPVVDKVDVKIALQMIRFIRMSKLEALEVLWTPQTENDSISEQELRRDFGLLMRPSYINYNALNRSVYKLFCIIVEESKSSRARVVLQAYNNFIVHGGKCVLSHTVTQHAKHNN